MTPLSSGPDLSERSARRFIGFVRYQALRLRARWTHWSLDASLAAGVDPASDPVLIVRARQLRSARNRRRLAGWIERLLEAEATHSPRLSAAVPVASRQVAEAREALLFLAHLLRHAERVQPRGIAMVEQFLTDGSSVLYVETARGALALQVRVALDCLVGEREATPEAWFSISDDPSGDLVGHVSPN